MTLNKNNFPEKVKLPDNYMFIAPYYYILHNGFYPYNCETVQANSECYYAENNLCFECLTKKE